MNITALKIISVLGLTVFLSYTVVGTVQAGVGPYNCDKFGQVPTCRAVVGNATVDGGGLCAPLKGRCGCAPVSTSGSDGGCPGGLEAGDTYRCIGYVGKSLSNWQCTNKGTCNEEESTSEGNSEEEDSGVHEVRETGMGDGRGIIESSVLNPDGSPSRTAGGYSSQDYNRKYEVVSADWATEHLEGWTSSAFTAWHEHNTIGYIVTTGGDGGGSGDLGGGEVIVSNCFGQCPGEGPWVLGQGQISSDCVNLTRYPDGEEGVVNFEEGECKSCSESPAAEACLWNGQNLIYQDSCDWEKHCEEGSLLCGARPSYRCPVPIPPLTGKCPEEETMTCQEEATKAWTWKKATSCSRKSQCFRELKASLGGVIDGGCGEEETTYQLVLNRDNGCKWESDPTPLGQETSQQDLNPGDCARDLQYTAHFKIGNGEIGMNFFENVNGQCQGVWSKLEAPDGIKGLENVYGHAGSNGRWILKGGSGQGWTFNQADCSFTCERYDEGADCHGEVLEAEVEFVPDLRLVIYRDNGFTAEMAPDSGEYTATHFDNCAIPGYDMENGGLNSATNNRKETYKPKRGIEYDFNGMSDSLYQPTRGATINTVAGQAPAYEQIILGENVSDRENIFSIAITNDYSSVDDEGYWACSCLAVDANDRMSSDRDCQLWFYPRDNKDICTTKRLYVGMRTCYDTAWWQVSGGNVYADQDIVDAVPTGLNNDPNCNPLAEIACEDVDSPDNHVNDFPNLDTEKNKGIPGDESCTPRIIRGRTPCKTDGPSNSAGIALTQHGRVVAADEYEYYFKQVVKDTVRYGANGLDMQKDLIKRVTERSNMHALFAGIYSKKYVENKNATNPTGIQKKVANSRVIPREDGTQVFQPPREDYRYFANLVGGVDNLEKIAPTQAKAKFSTFEQLKSRCYKMDGQTQTDEYVCYVNRDLTISSDEPWWVRAVNGKGQSYTVFVNGNLTITGQEEDSNAATAVDIGNFLGFIVSGNIVVDETVGILMPEPTSSELIKKCWEGQSATILGKYPDNKEKDVKNDQTTADKVSAIGAIEGVFVADGDLVIGTYPSKDMLCRVDKRFIGQGSFVSWSNVKLLRSFTPRNAGCQNDVYGVYNNRVPIETFIYRPDLVRNTPSWMKRSFVTYTEITGGK